RYSGRWYAVGHDVDRDDTRIFRLSRVLGEARAVGEFDAFEVPAEVDVRDIARTLAPAPPTGKAVLLLRQGSGYTLRRAADSTESGVTGPDGSDDWDRVVLTRVPADLVGAVLGHGPDAYVEEPEDLRREVGTRLEQLVARLDGAAR
ncbi:WYL domain-containing protein, partial [Nocardioides sp. NPDC000441]